MIWAPHDRNAITVALQGRNSISLSCEMDVELDGPGSLEAVGSLGDPGSFLSAPLYYLGAPRGPRYFSHQVHLAGKVFETLYLPDQQLFIIRPN